MGKEEPKTKNEVIIEDTAKSIEQSLEAATNAMGQISEAAAKAFKEISETASNTESLEAMYNAIGKISVETTKVMGQISEDTAKAMNQISEKPSYKISGTIIFMLLLIILLYSIDPLFSGESNIFIDISFLTRIPLFLLLGYVLFVIRSNLLFLYGFFELCIGIMAAYWSSVLNYSPQNATSYLFPILCGLYIMIRGLDNIYKSIKDDKVLVIWNKIFRITNKN
jgi:hypothetical protein